MLRNRGVLDATLRHELLHALMEAHAAPGLPLRADGKLCDVYGK